MTRYLAFLRGVNVGGKSLISMAALKTALSKDGPEDVSTYIQSGNVLFSSKGTDTDKLAAQIRGTIKRHFKLDVGVAVFSQAEWAKVIHDAPSWWGKKKEWKHNLWIFLESRTKQEIVAEIGTLKPDIESMEIGHRVVYQSLSFQFFGRATSGRLASRPIYKVLTIRNYNTANKLLALLG